MTTARSLKERIKWIPAAARTQAPGLAVVGLLAALFAAGTSAIAADTRTISKSANNCTALTRFHVPGVSLTIDKATVVPAGIPAPIPFAPPFHTTVPVYCRADAYPTSVVVGSPTYLARSPRPRVPQDLSAHDCIGLRLPTHGGLLGWEFRRRGRTVNIQSTGRLVFNTSELIVEAALAGMGLAWIPRDTVEEYIASRRLIPVLDEWAATYPGYHLYYASRRASPALALVVDALRTPDSSSETAEHGLS